MDQCRSELILVEPEAKFALQTLGSPTPPSSSTPTPNSVVTQAFEPGADLHGMIQASLRLPGSGSSRDVSLTGDVLGIAAGLGRCLALIAHTAGSDTNERELADRLAMLMDGMAKSLVVR